ncbi:MAG: hypothetical protein NT080_09415 [Spirochaetes bacterium]|nr:hypothetical protein [Spirochaetota bacterium]
MVRKPLRKSVASVAALVFLALAAFARDAVAQDAIEPGADMPAGIEVVGVGTAPEADAPAEDPATVVTGARDTGAMESRAAPVTTEADFFMICRRGTDGDATTASYGTARFSFDSEGSRDVKGQVVVEALFGNAASFGIRKAFVKARLAGVRLTMGKTTGTWGEGRVFNSGDVVFGFAADADLTAETISDPSAWLASLYVPLGDFSFAEAVFLPPEFPLSASIAKSLGVPDAPEPEQAGLESVRCAARVYSKPAGVKVEAGCLRDPDAGTWRPYASVQGRFLADLQLSSSVILPDDDPLGSGKTWETSGGIYHDIALGAGTFGLRVEGRVRPFGTWDASPIPRSPSAPSMPTPGASSAPDPYAASAFGEATWQSDAWFCFLRGLYSPVDASAQVSGGVRWKPLQGFEMFASISSNAGGGGDVYESGRDGGWSAAVGSCITF